MSECPVIIYSFQEILSNDAFVTIFILPTDTLQGKESTGPNKRTPKNSPATPHQGTLVLQTLQNADRFCSIGSEILTIICMSYI